MKVNALTVAYLAAGFIETAAWAPAISSLAARRTVSTPQQKSRLYVASSSSAEDKAISSQSSVDKVSEAFLDSRTKILGQPIPYSELTIGVLKETFKGENRVSQTPESVANLVKAGLSVIVQSGAGEAASFSDSAYMKAGALVLPKEQIFQDADIITKIRPPNEEEVPKLAGKTLISTIQPAINGDLYKELTEQNTNIFALDCVPRMLSRGQSYDTLSS